MFDARTRGKVFTLDNETRDLGSKRAETRRERLTIDLLTDH
jgi:hypothetical protein